jgi:hypothetical protein
MDTFLRRALDDLESAAGHLTADAIGRSAGDRWSIAGILEHLTLAFTLNRTVLEKALASGEVRARAPRLRQRLVAVLVVEFGYFPRVEAPEGTRPAGRIPPDRSVAAVREALIALDATCSRLAERVGEHTRVANHPYFAGLTVRQWRKFHWQHTRHHMRQVRARAGAGASAR